MRCLDRETAELVGRIWRAIGKGTRRPAGNQGQQGNGLGGWLSTTLTASERAATSP